MSVAQVSQNEMSLRAPKSFTAKSSELRFAMETSLKNYRHRGLGNVSLIFEGPNVVIQGHVRSYYLKQLAQEALRPLAVGMRIRNELQVH